MHLPYKYLHSCACLTSSSNDEMIFSAFVTPCSFYSLPGGWGAPGSYRLPTLQLTSLFSISCKKENVLPASPLLQKKEPLCCRCHLLCAAAGSHSPWEEGLACHFALPALRLQHHHPPKRRWTQLLLLGLATGLCNWILDFLRNRFQSVKIHNIVSSTIILNARSSHGCFLSHPHVYKTGLWLDSSLSNQLDIEICRWHSGGWTGGVVHGQ